MEPFVSCVVSASGAQLGPWASCDLSRHLTTCWLSFLKKVLDVYALKSSLEGLSPCKTCSIVNLILDMLISIRQYLALSLFSYSSKGHLYMIIHNMWSLLLYYIIFAGQRPHFLFFLKNVFIYGWTGSSLLQGLFSSGEQGLLFVALHRLLTVVAASVAEHGL